LGARTKFNKIPLGGASVMHVRISNFLLVCVCFAGLAQPAWSQIANKEPGKGIPGFLDPKTGAFTPSVQNPIDSEALAAAATTGKFVFNFTITVNSVIPKNGVVTCDANTDVFESSQSIQEHAFSFATLVSGSTWKCSVTIPYSWTLSTPASDMVSLSYSLAITEAFQLTASNATGTLVAPIAPRHHNHTIGAIKVPLTGSTTTENITATI
jgi:hypothetical protein